MVYFSASNMSWSECASGAFSAYTGDLEEHVDTIHLGHSQLRIRSPGSLFKMLNECAK
jgi:hypothetical protein